MFLMNWKTTLTLMLLLVFGLLLVPAADAQYYSSGYGYRSSYSYSYPSYYSSGYYTPRYSYPTYSYTYPSYSSGYHCEEPVVKVVKPQTVVVEKPVYAGGGDPLGILGGGAGGTDGLIKELLIRKLLADSGLNLTGTAPPAAPPAYTRAPPAGGLTEEEVAKLREILRAVKAPPKE